MSKKNAVSCELSQKQCVPCSEGVPRLRGKEIDHFLKDLSSDWKVVEERHLEKDYAFPDFRQALVFTNCVGELAEKEGHHPDIHLSWGKVKLMIWTHKINGLSENDFILAAKCDKEYSHHCTTKACF